MGKHTEAKELTTVEAGAPPALMEEFAADAGAGFEDMGQEDYALPFILLLQALSPQLDPTKAEYNEDAKPGMFLNTVTGDLYRELHVIPCAYAFRVVEKKARNQGGGFVARYLRHEAPTDFVRDEKGQYVRENGNVLVNTAYHYVLILDGEFPSQAVFAMRSTQLSKSKKWNAKMAAMKMKTGGKIITPPMYSSVYKIAAGKEANEHGSWFGFVVEREGYVQDADVLALAKQFSSVALDKKIAEPAGDEAVHQDGEGVI